MVMPNRRPSTGRDEAFDFASANHRVVRSSKSHGCGGRDRREQHAEPGERHGASHRRDIRRGWMGLTILRRCRSVSTVVTQGLHEFTSSHHGSYGVVSVDGSYRFGATLCPALARGCPSMREVRA